MNTKDQTVLEGEMNLFVGKLENRFTQLGRPGLKYFTGVIRDIFDKIKAKQKAKDDAIAKELMLAESDIKADSREKALERIYKIKGMLLLALLFLNIFQFTPVIRKKVRLDTTKVRMEFVIGRKGGESC